MKVLKVLMILLLFGFLTYGLEAGQMRIEKFSSGFNHSAVDSAKAKQDTGKAENIGIGPIKEVKLGAIDKELVKKGRNIFNSKCMACHRLDTKLVGPPLENITKQLSPVYIMNYLLNTTEMQKKEPQLKKLIKEYNGVVMPDQGLNKKQAREVLEYFRSVAK